MAVVMISELPGVDAGFAQAAREMGILDEMVAAPGFVSHVSGATSSGYRVVEVWESREAWQDWFDGHVVPRLPPGVEATTPEMFELSLNITPA
jgi:heme-degrading monooxygenase HmoA